MAKVPWMRRPTTFGGTLRTTRLLAVGALASSLGLAALLPPGVAAGAGSWVLQAAPAATTSAGFFDGVACASSTSCLAVGNHYTTGGIGVTMAESWSGTAWATSKPLNPVGAHASRLASVACLSATSCTAVGYSFTTTAGIDTPLAEGWSGTTWKLEAVPLPAGATFGLLNGVACSTGQCIAVGDYNNGAGAIDPLAERWNGTSWSVETVPAPSGSPQSQLSAVSCWSTGATTAACEAVGNYYTSSFVQEPLAEGWNGTSWALQTMPLPASATGISVGAISCPLSGTCLAVGGYSGTAGAVTLAERWNGTSWSVVSTPNPSSAAGSSLSAVSCDSAEFCMAVGSYTDKTNGDKLVTLAESWSGLSWALQSTPNPTASKAALLAVGCSVAATTNVCSAVGYDQGTPNSSSALAEGWNGTAWALQVPKDLPSAAVSSLAGISCAAASSCLTVGESVQSTGHVLPLAEAWGGTKWALTKLASVSGSGGTSLTSVACTATATTSCEAAGYYDLSGTSESRPLVEAWNGTAWSLQTTPNPSGAIETSLLGIACTSSTSCVAVGADVNGSLQELPLAETWNGTAWSVASVPSPAGSSAVVLTGVSCSGTSCQAVGSYDNSSSVQVTLAEHWNGTAWSIESTPNPTGATASSLSAVSCPPSSSDCSAVGLSDNTSGHSTPVAMRWNGTAWSIQTTPAPSGATSSSFGGVSCTSASACTAVGTDSGNSGIVTLAESWNGTAWSVDSTANPVAASNNKLSAVSCTGSAACEAAGVYNSPIIGTPAPTMPLIEAD